MVNCGRPRAGAGRRRRRQATSATQAKLLPEVDLTLREPGRLRELAGELARNFELVSAILAVEVTQRGERVRFRGPQADLAARVVQELYDLVGAGLALHPSMVEHACRLAHHDPQVRLRDYFGDVVFVGHGGRPIFPRSPNQRLYVQAIRSHDIVLGIGPAGTGKTYLAMAMALAALLRGEVARIVLCRPAVEAGEKLGYLPGGLAEKVDPYLRPLYDALYDMVDYGRAGRLLDRGVIEVAPLAFMRGRTLSGAYVILDEAQNSTGEQMQMFLTRLGLGSKAIVTGDVTQVDLPRGRVSGLVEARDVLSGIDRIGCVEFTHQDVVRHHLVSEIVRAYGRHHARPSTGGEE